MSKAQLQSGRVENRAIALRFVALPKCIRVVPMGLSRSARVSSAQRDPRGRTYYWMTLHSPLSNYPKTGGVTPVKSRI